MGYRGYGLPLAEVISEGNIGLMQAVRKFDPDKGFRLATYAMWWIRAAIQEYVLRSWSLVKLGTTAAQKKLFFNLRKIKSEIQAVNDGSLKPEQISAIADRLGVNDAEVEMMDGRMRGSDSSLNTPIGTEDDTQWQDWLADDQAQIKTEYYDEVQEYDARMALLNAAMVGLNEREQHILRERRLKDTPSTLEDLANIYDISRERVRQIEVRAYEKLQKAMHAEAVSQGLLSEE